MFSLKKIITSVRPQTKHFLTSQYLPKSSSNFRKPNSLILYALTQRLHFSTANIQSTTEPSERKVSIKLSELPSKSVKDCEVPNLIQALERYNINKENLFDELEKKEASDLINSIELRILKEVQLNKYPFALSDTLAILEFFVSHLSGSVKFFAELENIIPALLKSSPEQPLQLDIRTLGKIINASSKTNSFNKQFYEALNTAAKTLFDQCKDFSTQDITDFIDSLYLLTRKLGSDPSAVVSLGNKLVEIDFYRISLEKLSNFVWMLLLKTNFDPLLELPKKAVLPCEDIDYEDVKGLIESCFKQLDSLVTLKAFRSLDTLPFSLKFRLRQIAIIKEAIDPKGSLEDPMVAALSTVEAIRWDNTNETSLIHDDVTAILRAMNINKVEREKKVLIYPCDLFMSPDLIVEVNGPTHYVGYNHQCGVDDMDGRTFMKYKGLAMHGYQVRFISFREWYSIKGVTNKMNFVRDKIYAKLI